MFLFGFRLNPTTLRVKVVLVFVRILQYSKSTYLTHFQLKQRYPVIHTLTCDAGSNTNISPTSSIGNKTSRHKETVKSRQSHATTPVLDG